MTIKHKIINTIVASIVALSTPLLLSGCFNTDKANEDVVTSYHQTLDYSETTEVLNNPDQGFYRPISLVLDENSAYYNESIINDETKLYHIRADISAFSAKVNENKDIDITEDAITGLRKLLEKLEEKDKSAVVRFAYDTGYDGNANLEPDIEMIKRHIISFAIVLNDYPKTIAGIEVGLLGPWGEMHTSTIATLENISILMKQYLESVREIPILVRTPKMIYNYLGITIDDLDKTKINQDRPESRIGLFNDGYLGSNSDLGTYTDREKEIAWLSSNLCRLPYGGEVVVPDSTLHNIENCIPEMFSLGLSYLNIEWNNKVIEKWTTTYYTKECGDDELFYGKTAYEYISAHMGYRYVLNSSILSYNKDATNFGVNLKLTNKGFGSLTKEKQLYLYIVDTDNNIVFNKYFGSYNGETELNLNTSLNLSSGEYKVYISINNGSTFGHVSYPIAFANNLYDDTLCANLVGSFKI